MRHLRPLNFVLVVGLALLSCDGHYRLRDAKRVSSTLLIPAATTEVRLEVPAGSVSIEPSPGNDIVYEAEVQRSADTAEDLETLKALEPGLRIVPGPQAGRMRVVAATLPAGLDPHTTWLSYRMLVKIPKTLRVDLVIGDGNASVIGMQSGAGVETGRGILLLKQCSGDSRMRSGKGDLTVDSHMGALDAETGAGKIVAFVDALGAKGLRLVSGSGGIQAHLPRESAFTLDMRAPEGKVDATWQFPIRREHGGVFMSGTVGVGGPLVYIESLAGSVSLRAEGSK